MNQFPCPHIDIENIFGKSILDPTSKDEVKEVLNGGMEQVCNDLRMQNFGSLDSFNDDPSGNAQTEKC